MSFTFNILLFLVSNLHQLSSMISGSIPRLTTTFQSKQLPAKQKDSLFRRLLLLSRLDPTAALKDLHKTEYSCASAKIAANHVGWDSEEPLEI